jgi:Sec-independent protein secretion pathway component TatC
MKKTFYYAGTFAVVCLMTGKSVTAYSSQMAEGNITSTETTHYNPMEVATAVTFMVGIYQVYVMIFPLNLNFPGGWDDVIGDRE